MTFWTLDRLVEALGDLVSGARPIGGDALGAVATDSRTVAAGDIFVALAGDRFDAHDFLGDAVACGASALVVSDPRRTVGLGRPVLAVDDTVQALGALAVYRRRAWRGVVVGIAGSNGKTSTKELVRAALSPAFTVHATHGNLNNHIGVPLTLLAIPDDADVAVVEVGTNHPGEVHALRALVEPDVAVVTSIGEEHLEGLGDLTGVLREESAIFEGARIAVTPSAFPEVREVARTMAPRVIDAGIEGGDVTPDTWGVGSDGRGWLTVGDTRVDVPLLGAHNVQNALLALVVARVLGVPDADAARGIAAMGALPMRSSIEVMGELMVLNDAYNANPASARAALATLAAIEPGRPRVVVLGSMLELGAHAASFHDEIARLALASDAVAIVGAGEFRAAFTRVAPDDHRVVTADDVEDAWEALRARLPANAVVLLKGSRGARLERLLPHLRAFAGVERSAAPDSVH